MAYVDAALERAQMKKFGLVAREVWEDGEVERIRSALTGDPSILFSCFIFADTPQGHNHWEDRATGKVPLSDDDKKWIKDLATFVAEKTSKEPTQCIADHVAEVVTKPVHAYQVARKVEDLVVDAAAIRPTRREISIAITHLETAAMWLNKAHYAAKKE